MSGGNDGEIGTRVGSRQAQSSGPFGPLSSSTFATWNPSNAGASIVLSNGNLTATNSSTWNSVTSTVSHTTGKYYWEITVNNTTPQTIVGLCDGTTANPATYTGNFNYSFGTGGGANYNTPNFVDSGSALNFPNTNDVVSFAVDFGGNQFWLAYNGVWSGSSPTGTAWGTWSGLGAIFASMSVQSGAEMTANFGASAFSYTVPAGFNSGLF